MNMKKTRLYIALLSSYSLHIKTLMLAWFFLLPLFLSAIMNAEDENHASNLPSGELSNAILKQSDWWQTEQQNIRQMEYDVSYQEHCLIPGGKAGYHMANRAQNLRAYFYPEGLKVLRRMEKKPSWICGFQLAGFGRQGNVQLLQMDSKLTVEKNLIEYHHGPLIERYENREDGIKQSFIIAEAPTGIGPLVLVVRLSSNLSPQLTTRDSAVRFLHNGTAVIKYGGLEAIDATGRKLRAQLSLVGDQLHILINDASSVYPVTIDPLLTGLSSVPDWTAESDQAWAYFGCSVSTAGDVNGDGYTDVIIGAYYYDNGEGNEGRAFLYLGSPTGLSAIPDWIAESNQTDAYFGMSVFTAGDVNGDGYSDVIVGAPWYTNGELEEGRAFVYHGSASRLSTIPDWTAESNQANAGFGRSVSTAGDINGDSYADAIVGAPWYDNGESWEGRAFVYHGSASPPPTAADSIWSYYE